MKAEKLLRCSYPQEMLVVFGADAALEVARPLIEHVSCFSQGALLESPAFVAATQYCRRVLDDELAEPDFEPFVAMVTRCVAMACTEGLGEEERAFGGVFFELERMLEHPFTYEVSTS